ncbi:19178_t:CDS:2, partial [Cetraspora pellucida]
MDKNRTCGSINIPLDFCPCLEYEDLNYGDKEQMKKIDNIISLGVTKINDMLTEYNFNSVCHTFAFKPSKADSKNITVSFKNGFISSANEVYTIIVKVNGYMPAKIEGESLNEYREKSAKQ